MAKRSKQYSFHLNLNNPDHLKIYRTLEDLNTDIHKSVSNFVIKAIIQYINGASMTSKSVSRTCEDIDEATLSYAEIKAVATGNPMIKEKMEIDNDVQRLKLLKASYDSQRYSLQDNFMIRFPKLIKAAEEKLACVREDLKARDAALLASADFSITVGNDGAVYEVSPWSLSWDDENYYLIAYESSEGMIKHFRVDKMLHIKSNGKAREGKQAFKSFDMAAYARKMFGMYGGKEEWVRIECDNSFAGVMIDRFGKDVSMIRIDDKRFVVNVEVAVSRQFLAWIIGLGEGVILAGPEHVVEMMNAEIDRLAKQYKR